MLSISNSQDYYIMLKLGCANRDFSHMSTLDDFHKCLKYTFYFCPFRQIWPIVAWADRPVWTSSSGLKGKKKVLDREVGLCDYACKKSLKVELNDSWSGAGLSNSNVKSTIMICRWSCLVYSSENIGRNFWTQTYA